MLRVIRIGLIALTVMLLIGAGILFYYNYTHEDISKPTFQASSATIEVSVKAERKDLCAGLHAYDNMDGDITDRIMVQSISNFSADDSFRVRYIVFDRASNYSVCERVARYTDYTPPTFALNKPMVFNVGDTVTYLDRTGITVIRPFLYAPEKDIRYIARHADLPILEVRCPADGNTERSRMKQFLANLEKDNKGLRHRIFGAIQKAGLDGFRAARVRRYKDEEPEDETEER